MGKERVEEMKSGGVEGGKSLPVEESEKRNAEQLPPAVELVSDIEGLRSAYFCFFLQCHKLQNASTKQSGCS